MLIPMAFLNRNLALLYGLLTTVMSVAGAVFGYWIGKKGGKPILKRFFADEKIEKVKILFHKYDAWAVFLAAFTPIPFKVFTISGGTFDINFQRFVLASALGRGTRYMLLSGLIVIFGESARNFIEHQLDQALIIMTGGLIGGVVLLKYALPTLKAKLYQETFIQKVTRIFSSKR